MLSPEWLAARSLQTGYQESALEKVDRLLELLVDIHRHPLLSRVLVLKGGTALHLGFGNPRRLSVDLDFNYIGALERDAMQREKPRLEEALARIVQAQGYQAQWSRPAHAGRKCFLNYRSASGAPDRIEVDLNFLHRQLLLPTTLQKLWSPDPEKSITARLISLPELCAGKICALLDRMMPRDLYDIACLSQIASEEWSSQSFRPIIIALSGALPHPLYHYHRNRVQHLSNELVQRQLHPLLIQSQEPTVEELLETAWPLVEPFLQLTEQEREFVDCLQEGELLPELLFPDDAAQAEKVRQHPVLVWKAQNAARHRRGGND